MQEIQEMRESLQELQLENGRLRSEQIDEEILLEIRDRILGRWRLARQVEKLDRIKIALDQFVRQVLKPSSELPKKYKKNSRVGLVYVALEEYQIHGDRDRFFDALQKIAEPLEYVLRREPILLSQKRDCENWNIYSLKIPDLRMFSSWEPQAIASFLLKACREEERKNKEIAEKLHKLKANEY